VLQPAGHTTVGPPAVLHLVGVVAPWPRRLARHSGLGKCGGVRCFRGQWAPCSYCPAWWNGGPSAPASVSGACDGHALAAAEMPRINCLCAPGPAETAHGYPLHCATSRRGGGPPARRSPSRIERTPPSGASSRPRTCARASEQVQCMQPSGLPCMPDSPHRQRGRAAPPPYLAGEAKHASTPRWSAGGPGSPRGR